MYVAQLCCPTAHSVYKFICFIGRHNPYCEVIVDGQKGNIRTDTKKKTTTPEWDEEFTVYVCVCVLVKDRVLVVMQYFL